MEFQFPLAFFTAGYPRPGLGEIPLERGPHGTPPASLGKSGGFEASTSEMAGRP